MSIVLTSTRQRVNLTSSRTGVTLSSSRPRVTLTADRQGRPGADGATGPAGEGAVKVDWLVRRFGTGTPALDPIGDFAAWEAAAVAYWNLSDGDDFAFYDTLTRTQSGIYTYTAGVGVARKTGFTTTDDLHRTAAVGKLYRSHIDDTVWTSPAFTTGFVVFLADDPTDAIGTAEWYVDWLVDDRSFQIVLDHLTDTTAAHTPQAVDAQPAISTATFDDDYTITNETFLGTFGTQVTFPLASARDGETITIYPLTQNVTLTCSGSDVFNPPGAATSSMVAGDVSSFTAVAALGIWVPAIRSGSSFDLPGFVNSPPDNGSVVAYSTGGGLPTWLNGNGILYEPSAGDAWDTSPATIGAAFVESARRGAGGSDVITSGAYYPAAIGTTSVSTTNTITANRLYLLPFTPAETTTIDQIGITVGSSNGGNIRCGIYYASTGARLSDHGTTAVTASTPGFYSISVNVTLYRGVPYYLAFVSDTALTNVYGLDGWSAGWTSGTDTGLSNHAYVSHTYGALPDPLGTIVIASGSPTHAPRILVRAS